MISFDHSFQTLPRFFFEPTDLLPLKNAELLHTTPIFHELGLDGLSESQFLRWLNGETRVPGDERISTRYAGHQFGVWAGQLGDGRAISLGEIQTKTLGRQEIQMKGSGPTPFSRRGDGKAVLRSCIREHLCAEAMQALGIPTTRSLALLRGDGLVERESLEPEAMVARVFPTNLRFGHFEMAYHFEKKTELLVLIEYTLSTFFPGHSLESMLREVVDRTALMIAEWQAIGFCHGVMNTDNFSILGITLDYGPFGFMEDFDPNFVCNHSDHEGRYAYSMQPKIAFWNLERLLICFRDQLSDEALSKILNAYPERFRHHLFSAYQKKLGLNSPLHEGLLQHLIQFLTESRLDYTFFFRELSHYEIGKPDSISRLIPHLNDAQSIRTFLDEYDRVLFTEGSNDSQRTRSMLKTNPKWVFKNHIAQSIIASAEQGDRSLLTEWFKVLQNPFVDHGKFEDESLPTPKNLKSIPVSCSS